MSDKLRAEWFWTDRWFSSSACALPIDARGLYRELLTRAWSLGAKLPSNHAMLIRLAGVTQEEWDRCWPMIEKYWREDGDHLVNDTQLEVYADANKRKKVRTDRARKAAQARWGQCSSNAQASNKQCPPSPSLSLSKKQTQKKKPPSSVSPRAAAFSERLARVPQWDKLGEVGLIKGGNYLDAYDILPAAIVDEEVGKMIQWALANPTKCMKKNLPPFFSRWLGKAADNGAARRATDNGNGQQAEGVLPPSHPCFGLEPGQEKRITFQGEAATIARDSKTKAAIWKKGDGPWRAMHRADATEIAESLNS